MYLIVVLCRILPECSADLYASEVDEFSHDSLHKFPSAFADWKATSSTCNVRYGSVLQGSPGINYLESTGPELLAHQ